MTRSAVATVLAVFTAVMAGSAAPAAALPVCPIVNGQTVTYDILRNETVIGRQTLRYGLAGPDLTVTIDVVAAISAMGIRVYNYAHHGEERWHDGQLVQLTTRTDDDGTPRRVDASRDPQTGLWRGITGPSPGPGPLLSSSLWNSQTVTQTRLIDRETGEVVFFRPGGAQGQTIALGARQVRATKYDLEGSVVKGDVWYDASGCWVQAVFHTKVDGSLIEVRLH